MQKPPKTERKIYKIILRIQFWKFLFIVVPFVRNTEQKSSTHNGVILVISKYMSGGIYEEGASMNREIEVGHDRPE